jgi:hypothetical protein
MIKRIAVAGMMMMTSRMISKRTTTKMAVAKMAVTIERY